MNPWLLLLNVLGWVLFGAIALAILLFFIIFMAAAVQTVRQNIATRKEQDRITTVSILSTPPESRS